MCQELTCFCGLVQQQLRKTREEAFCLDVRKPTEAWVATDARFRVRAQSPPFHALQEFFWWQITTKGKQPATYFSLLRCDTALHPSRLNDQTGSFKFVSGFWRYSKAKKGNKGNWRSDAQVCFLQGSPVLRNLTDWSSWSIGQAESESFSSAAKSLPE